MATDYRCPCCQQPLEDCGAKIVGRGEDGRVLECSDCPSYGHWQWVNSHLLFDVAFLRGYWEEVPAYDPAEHALR